MTPGLTVCIVDDDESVRESLTGLLRSAGFDARPFRSAEHFLSEGDRSAMRCAILDVTMPGLSGADLQERLREEGLTFPIVFITARSEPSLHTHLLARGAVACLIKPFHEDELLDTVRAVTRRPATAEGGPT